MKALLLIAMAGLAAGAASAQQARFSVAEFSVAAPPGWREIDAPAYSFVEFNTPKGSDVGRVFVTTRHRFGTLDEDVASDRNLAWTQHPRFLSKVTQVSVAGADCRGFSTIYGPIRTDRVYCALSVPDGADRSPMTFIITAEGTPVSFPARSEALAKLINSVRWGRAVDW